MNLNTLRNIKPIIRSQARRMLRQAVRREQAKAYAKGSTVVPVPLEEVWFEPTNICNLRCIHCIQPQMTRKKGYMDFSLFQKLVDEASFHGMAIGLAGQGEPLLHPEFTKMVRYASSRCYTYLVTNANRLNEKIAKEIIEAEPATVQFTFDAPTKEIYEKICQGGSYETTAQNIKRFAELKRESGKTWPQVAIAIVEEPGTRDKIDQFQEWCYTTLGRDVISAVLPQRLGNFQGESELWRSGEVIDEDMKPNLPRSEWPVCINPWRQIRVNWDGTVASCLWDYNNKFIIGSVKENTIMEIWNGPKMREFREALATRQYERIEGNGHLCSTCNILWWPEMTLSYPRTARANLEYGLTKISKGMRLFGLTHKLGIK